MMLFSLFLCFEAGMFEWVSTKTLRLAGQAIVDTLSATVGELLAFVCF